MNKAQQEIKFRRRSIRKIRLRKKKKNVKENKFFNI